MIPPPPSSTLFPYTTLFRSQRFGQLAPFDDVLNERFAGDGMQRFAGKTARSVAGRDEAENFHKKNLGTNRADRKQHLIAALRSEEHTSELQSLTNLVCRLLL